MPVAVIRDAAAAAAAEAASETDPDHYFGLWRRRRDETTELYV